LCILEVFNDSIIVISKSNNKYNKYISANHSFRRNEVYFFDTNENKKAMLDIEDLFYLFPIKAPNISATQREFFIEKIDLSDMKVVFSDSDGVSKTYDLSGIESSTLKCN